MPVVTAGISAPFGWVVGWSPGGSNREQRQQSIVVLSWFAWVPRTRPRSRRPNRIQQDLPHAFVRARGMWVGEARAHKHTHTRARARTSVAPAIFGTSSRIFSQSARDLWERARSVGAHARWASCARVAACSCVVRARACVSHDGSFIDFAGAEPRKSRSCTANHMQRTDVGACRMPLMGRVTWCARGSA
jgi:hypothetical protein